MPTKCSYLHLLSLQDASSYWDLDLRLGKYKSENPSILSNFKSFYYFVRSCEIKSLICNSIVYPRKS